MDNSDAIDTAARALFAHWQRGLTEASSAKLRYDENDAGTAPIASASLRGVFIGKATAVIAALFPVA